MRDLPGGTVTFLFTDVEGSTRLLDELGAERYAEALGEHRRALREAFARHGGVEVDTQGDAFFYAFASAPEALAAAEEAQAALLKGPIRVRMGLHTGTPHRVEEGYVGPDVHRAARIAAAGHGGQILVSTATAGLVDRSALRDLGEHRLKDLSAPERIYQLGRIEFAPLKTLYQTNLPVPSTPFVGRERELAQVAELLSREDVRLLTLTGTGGTGKTRLAAQAAALVSDAYPHGVWWVPLAPIREPELVPQAAAQALGAADGLDAHIGDKRMLVLFDNFEQVADAAGALGDLLSVCPNLDLLVTSREPLHLTAEQEFPVPPFAHEEGVGFFLARARAVRPDVEPGGAVSDICRRLDDLPLALELAAARVKALSTDQILERLERRLPLLTGGARDLPERQRTLRSTIEWSYELLTEGEQRLFRRLGVFSGGCKLEAAEEVAEAELDTLQSLVEKSLVRFTGERYWLLETIREFAVEELDDEDLFRKHAEYYLAVAEAGNLALESIGKAPPRHELVLPERDNIRAAIEWSTENDVELGLRLTVALENFWVTHDPNEGARRFRALLDRSEGLEPALLAPAWRDYGGTLDSARLAEEARAAYAKSGELFGAAGDERGAAEANYRIGVLDLVFGDWDVARRRFEESIEVYGRLPDPGRELQVLGLLGQGEMRHGDPERGRQLIEKSLAMGHESGWRWWQASLLHTLAEHEVERTGDVEQAERYGREIVGLARQVDHRNRALYGLAVLAWAAGERGDAERAAQLWATVENEEPDPGRHGRFDPEVYRPKIPDLELPRPAMSLEEAMEYALGFVD